LDSVTTAVAFAYLAYVEPLQRFEEWIFHGLNALAVIHPVLLLLLLHPFNGLFSRKTWVSRYQKGKTSLDLNEARDGEVLESNGISRTLCKQYALHSREITNHSSTSSLNFLQAGCFSWHPANSVKALIHPVMCLYLSLPNPANVADWC